MSRPITWQNIQGPAANSIGAERGYNFAAEGITDGLDRLAKIFTNQEALASAAQERDREAQALGFKDMLGQARTVQDLDALRASGQLDAAYNALDPRTRAKVFGAADARRAGLIQDTTNNDAFQQQQLDKTQAPIVDQIRTAIERRDFAAANALMEANPGLRNTSALASALRQGERGVVTEQRQDEQFRWQQSEERRKDEEAMRKSWRDAEENELRRLRILEAKRVEANYPAEDAARKLTAATAARTAELDRRDQARRADGNVYTLGGGIYGPQHSANVAKILTDAKVEPDKAAEIIRAIAGYRYVQEVTENGKKLEREIPLPLAVVEEAVRGLNESASLWGTNKPRDVIRAIKAQMDRVSKDTFTDPANPQKRQTLVEMLDAYRNGELDKTVSPLDELPTRGRAGLPSPNSGSSAETNVPVERLDRRLDERNPRPARPAQIEPGSTADNRRLAREQILEQPWYRFGPQTNTRFQGGPQGTPGYNRDWRER